VKEDAVRLLRFSTGSWPRRMEECGGRMNGIPNANCGL